MGGFHTAPYCCSFPNEGAGCHVYKVGDALVEHPCLSLSLFMVLREGSRGVGNTNTAHSPVKGGQGSAELEGV